MRIGLLGDTHGNANVVLAALRNFFVADIDTVIQLGDFGFKSDKHGSAFLNYVNTLASKNGITLHVVPGNHEDYTFLKTLRARGDGWLEAKSNILVAPRGFRWDWRGRSFVALGGAPSINRTTLLRGQRMYGIPMWWEEEDITTEDMEKTMGGGRADIMVAHDAPLGVPQIEKIIEKSTIQSYEHDRAYAFDGRAKMATVVDVVRPKLFFHGHYHQKIDDTLEIFNETTGLDDVVRVKGLAADGSGGSSGILNLDSMKFSFLYH